VPKKNGMGIGAVDVGTGWKFEYEGNCVGGNGASVPGSVIINPGGITLCSGINTAEVGSPASTVTAQKLISVMVNVGMSITVVFVSIEPAVEERRVVVSGGHARK